MAAWVLLYDGGKQGLDLTLMGLDLSSFFLKIDFCVGPLKKPTP
jgi:hypothetical protein